MSTAYRAPVETDVSCSSNPGLEEVDQMAEFVTVGKADDIKEGEATAFQVGDEEVAVARSGGTLYAFNDICTHRRCNLAMGGEIDGTTITCECHGSMFDMATGEVIGGPAPEPIATYEVREENGDLQVGVQVNGG